MKFYVKEKASGKAICSPEQAFEALKKIYKADQESFWVLGFNAQNKEILRECIFLGGVNMAIVDPKILFRRLLQHGAFAFIVAHNHPSGSLEFSPEDKEMTQQIKQGAKILDLNFLDHLIVGEKERNIPGFVSYRDSIGF